MENLRTVEVTVEDVAKELGYSGRAFHRELSLIGWCHVIDEAERLASIDRWNKNSALPEKQRIRELQVTYEILIRAAELVIPRRKPKPNTPRKAPVPSKEGYVYVLYDAETHRCKIGCTSTADGKRQWSLMRSHGAVLVNVLNAKVKDRYATEAQCHEQFKEYRKGGEWFEAPLVDVVNYIHQSVDWSELDFENTARMVQYIVGSELGDIKAAQDALSENEKVKQ